MPDSKQLCVLFSSENNNSSTWYSKRLKFEADALFHEYLSRAQKFDEEIRQQKEINEKLYKSILSKNPDEKGFGNVADALTSAKEIFQKPVVTAESLIEFLPRAAKFGIPISGDIEKIEKACKTVIAQTCLQPSRDGSYTILLPVPRNRKAYGLVTWVPNSGLPSYPEVRWAVQKRLPIALLIPRITQSNRPTFDPVRQEGQHTIHCQGFDPESNVLQDALREIEFDQSDLRNRVEDVRSGMKSQGFEAIAWFQPFHEWTEETWGIHFDAGKLDELALSFLEDFKSAHIHGSHSLAALLAFGLTYAHELFHARVEAAISWAEINAQQPRHLRYKVRVYQGLRETPDWLEEALANWSAWDWFKEPSIQSLVACMASDVEGLDHLVEASLDLAPPGYREWRLGHQPGSWRTFANQLSTGNPKIATTRIGLPLESALTGPLPYDFQPADIPLRFVGHGVIADRLQSHPATFNVPPRRELERALKHYRHSLDASGGKGGHQKWTGPDQRAFILPTRDPVSTGVFKTFLHHVGIDKATYVRQVRPNL
jgi:hypothetical protein